MYTPNKPNLGNAAALGLPDTSSVGSWTVVDAIAFVAVLHAAVWRRFFVVAVH